MEFCCYICCRGQSKFLFYLLAYHYVNTRAWKNIKEKYPNLLFLKAKPFLIRCSEISINCPVSSLQRIFTGNAQATTLPWKKQEHTEQQITICISSKLQACFSFYWYWLQTRHHWTTDAHIRRHKIYLIYVIVPIILPSLLHMTLKKQ